MEILNVLIKYLKSKNTVEEQNLPEGFCPNCWGRNEYEGQFFEAVKNHNTDVNSANPNIGWIQDYANKNLSGIQLVHEGDNLVCQKCKLSYKK